MQSQNTSLNSLINYNMLSNNKQKNINSRNMTSTRHFATSTINIPKKLPYGDLFMETTSNIDMEFDNSCHKTMLSEINKMNQEFKQNLNEKSYNMDYQVAADMLKKDSNIFYEKKMPETKPTPESNSSYKVDFYPVVLGVANFITGLFNNITGGGWVFSNKNTSEKEEKEKMCTQEKNKEEEITKYSLFEELSCLNDSSLLFANEISLNDIKSMSENDVTLASINSQVEYRNKTVAAEQSALLNSFQSCRRHTSSPAFIPDQFTHDNINESEIIPQDIEKEKNKEMNSQNKPNCTEAVEICEDKLAKIRDILKKGGSNKQGSDSSKTASKSIRNRRRRMFVPPHSIEVNSIDDVILETDDSIERMQNMMFTKFSHPGVVIEPEIVEIEPAMTFVNRNMDEVDFCITDDMKIHPNMKEETFPIVNFNENNHLYIDSLKSYAQKCLQEADNGGSCKNNSESERNSTKNTNLSTILPEINETTDNHNTTSIIQTPSTSNCEEIIDNSPPILKKAVISNCEDKMARLKEMLSERKEKYAKDFNANPIDDSNGNKRICEDDEEFVDENYECMDFDSVIARKSTPKPVLTKDKHCDKKHKNSNSRIPNKDKGRRLLRRNIVEDISLGRDLSALNLSSSLEDECRLPKSRQKNLRRAQAKARRQIDENPRALNIPDSAFDEVKGKFKNSASDCSSDDSFIVVFSESPMATPPVENTLLRQRIASDAGSEDSFVICFESDNENGNCYTNTDIFNESDSESETDSETETSDSDSDSDISSDGDSMSNLVNCSFGNSMSRTVSDLTDQSLYADDSVLAATTACDSDDGLDKYGKYCDRLKKFSKHGVGSCMSSSRTKELDEVGDTKVTTDKPVKKVRFSEAAPRVMVLRVWAYAARAARIGPWERAARDRDRFRNRISNVEMAISWVLKPQHRTRVKFQRFMPWWNAQRRQEIAEKKEKAEEDRRKQEKEEEKVRLEEDENSQDEIEPEQDEMVIRREESGIQQEETGIRQEETGLRHEESGIRQEETGIRQEKTSEERLCNGSLEDDNIERRLNNGKNAENDERKENISTVVKTEKDKKKTAQETNKQNLYAIQVYDTYKGEKFIENCIDSKKILIKN